MLPELLVPYFYIGSRLYIVPSAWMETTALSSHPRAGMEHNLIIVERVLSYLPIAEIVRAQRVCRAWRDVVRNPTFLLGAWARCDPVGHDLYCNRNLILSRKDHLDLVEIAPASTRDHVAIVLDQIATRFCAIEELHRISRTILFTQGRMGLDYQTFSRVPRLRWRHAVAPFAFLAPDIVMEQFIRLADIPNPQLRREVACYNMPECWFRSAKLHFDTGILVLGLFEYAKTMASVFGKFPITDTGATAMHWFLYGCHQHPWPLRHDPEMFSWLLESAKADSTLGQIFFSDPTKRKKHRTDVHNFFWRNRADGELGMDEWANMTPVEMALYFPEITPHEFTLLYDANPAAFSMETLEMYAIALSIASFLTIASTRLAYQIIEELGSVAKLRYLFQNCATPALSVITEVLEALCTEGILAMDCTDDPAALGDLCELFVCLLSSLSREAKQKVLDELAESSWSSDEKPVWRDVLLFAAHRDPIVLTYIMTKLVRKKKRSFSENEGNPTEGFMHRLIRIGVTYRKDDCGRNMEDLPGFRDFLLSRHPAMGIPHSEALRSEFQAGPHRELVESKLSQWLSGV